MNATVEQLAPVNSKRPIIGLLRHYINLKKLRMQPICKNVFWTLVNGIKLCGTLIVASEGINGTVAGDRAAIDTVHQFLMNEGFAAMEYKESASSEKPFRKMKIKLKNEIVTLGVGG